MAFWLKIEELDKTNNIKTKTLSSVFNDEKKQLKKEKDELNKKKGFFSKAFICASVIVVFLLVSFVIRRNNQKKKLAKLQQEYLELVEREVMPEKQEYTIDDTLVNDILGGLSKIETSELYLSKDFTLNTLAKILKTNTSYLSQIINEHKGKPFRQYLFELRITYLLQHLEEDNKLQNYTIAALGELIGYTNASAFTRAFKKYRGISPSEYLKDKYGDMT